MLKIRLAVLSLGIAMMLPTSLALFAEKPNEAPAVPPAPRPTQILTAKRVFIANGGGGGFDREMFSGEPSRTYNEFYGAMKAWGHYDLVGTPAEADLVFQISMTRSTRFEGQTNFPAFQVRLVLLDPKTNTLLWALDEFILVTPGFGVMISKSNRDEQFDDRINRIVSVLKTLTAQPAATAK